MGAGGNVRHERPGVKQDPVQAAVAEGVASGLEDRAHREAQVVDRPRLDERAEVADAVVFKKTKVHGGGEKRGQVMEW
jgi:hypothetical protein